MTELEDMELWLDLKKFKDKNVSNYYVKVLIVDDIEFMYEMLKEMLNPDKYVIVGRADNGEEALHTYKYLTEINLRPDIVTMDIVMPNKSGISAIKDILRYDPEAVILVISALTPYDIKVKAIKAGAKGYLTKPFNFDELQAAFNKILVE
ncbi:MAG: response regulator [Methanosarcinales archaeon]|nr:response regulator [Methanosarcinales archaeon]